MSGNQYLMIVYDYDSNSILAEPMKSRTGPEMLRAYKTIHALLTSRGLKPRLQKLDNEASQSLKNYIQSQDIDLQQTPAGSH